MNLLVYSLRVNRNFYVWKPDAPQKAAIVTRTLIASPSFCSNPDYYFYDNFTISPWWLRNQLVSYRHPNLLIERCMCITLFSILFYLKIKSMRKVREYFELMFLRSPVHIRYSLCVDKYSFVSAFFTFCLTPIIVLSVRFNTQTTKVTCKNIFNGWGIQLKSFW